MKKIIASVMMIIVALICALTFVACSNTNVPTSSDIVNSDTNVPTSSDIATLVMNKRYISEEDVRVDTEKQVCYVFHADGTGEFTYHFDYTGLYSTTHYHYIIHFKYTYVDDDKSAVVCFYDSLERLDGDDGSYSNTAWSRLVTVSKNVLTTVGSSYTFWINEDYLKTIPHFGEKQT